MQPTYQFNIMPAEPQSILSAYATTHTAFLHAMGEAGTEALIPLLALSGTESVVELGFGTGATLVKLKSRYPKLRLSGIEASTEMKAIALKRLRFCRLENSISLYLLEETGSLPSLHTDLVYAESVLGILDEKSLSQALALVHRILKPEGLLYLNDSIWLEDISPEDIRRINDFCQKTLGIPQCNEQFQGIEKTRAYFQQHGFNMVRHVNLDPGMTKLWHGTTLRERCSKLFSLFGKYLAAKNRNTRQKIVASQKVSGSIFEPGKAYLCGTLMVFKKSAIPNTPLP
ncbi:MAG: class I SAM-dependent methyltransferase [Lewinellaceae bacterium]|nr:class I SAM-dependent methyltransferase [Lewinellaceae bacterium]